MQEILCTECHKSFWLDDSKSYRIDKISCPYCHIYGYCREVER